MDEGNAHDGLTGQEARSVGRRNFHFHKSRECGAYGLFGGFKGKARTIVGFSSLIVIERRGIGASGDALPFVGIFWSEVIVVRYTITVDVVVH